MIREFHLADWLTLGNAACGVGALFAVMSYLRSQEVMHLFVACALMRSSVSQNSRRDHSAAGRDAAGTGFLHPAFPRHCGGHRR